MPIFTRKKLDCAPLAKELIQLESNHPLVSLGQKNLLHALLFSATQPSSLPADTKLLLAAARDPQEYSSRKALALIGKVIEIAPARCLLVDENSWRSIFPQQPPLGIWAPSAEIIFLPNPGFDEHILLHEMIHSLQGGGYLEHTPYAAEKRILLEGVTEASAVYLDKQDKGYYEQERRAAASVVEQKFSPDEISFMNPERLFAFIAREIFSGADREKKLSQALRQEAEESKEVY